MDQSDIKPNFNIKNPSKSSKVKTTWDQEPTKSLSAINLWVFRKAHI